MLKLRSKPNWSLWPVGFGRWWCRLNASGCITTSGNQISKRGHCFLLCRSINAVHIFPSENFIRLLILLLLYSPIFASGRPLPFPGRYGDTPDLSGQIRYPPGQSRSPLTERYPRHPPSPILAVRHPAPVFYNPSIINRCPAPG